MSDKRGSSPIVPTIVPNLTPVTPAITTASRSAPSFSIGAFHCLIGAAILGLVLLLGACATGPRIVDHAFGFNAGSESPNYEILAYRYGYGKGVSRSSDNAIRQFGHSNQGTNINGPMPLGDGLYVKWRNKETKQEFEQTVDLRPLLPFDMTNQRIHFVVNGPQLFIYLIDPVTRPAGWPVVGPKKFHNEKIIQIYPR